MNKWIVTSFVFLVFSAQALASEGRPPRSLGDLPAVWNGIAGDLFSRTTSSFVVEKIKTETRNDKENYFSASYEVTATIKFGTKTLRVTQVDLSGAVNYPNVLEAILYIDDELVPILSTVILYEGASHTFSMKEVIGTGGDRRFSLTSASPF